MVCVIESLEYIDFLRGWKALILLGFQKVLRTVTPLNAHRYPPFFCFFPVVLSGAGGGFAICRGFFLIGYLCVVRTVTPLILSGF